VPRRPCSAYRVALDSVDLPPDLEQFAADAVAAGRYRDIGDVVRAENRYPGLTRKRNFASQMLAAPRFADGVPSLIR
jgi:hypothetical protein